MWLWSADIWPAQVHQREEEDDADPEECVPWCVGEPTHVV